MKVIEKRKNGSIRVYTVNNEPSMTDQQFKDDCDVNFIVNKFTKTGHLTHLAKFQGMYAKEGVSFLITFFLVSSL